MEIDSYPFVRLLSDTKFSSPPHINWKSDTENSSELLIEFAGRNCYQSWDNPSGKSNEEYIGNLLRQGHMSVLEHASATFIIEGVSRSFTHELVRHRHLSFSQLSQRYVDESSTQFVCPKILKEDDECNELFNQAVSVCLEYYKNLVLELDAICERKFAHLKGVARKKLVRQAARSVLPNATETKIVVTGNFRAWRHFINMRATSGADEEIREVAIKILKILQNISPAVFNDYIILQNMDGTGLFSHL